MTRLFRPREKRQKLGPLVRDFAGEM